jgi:putative lipase involved disintegration of autophagic bodies
VKLNLTVRLLLRFRLCATGHSLGGALATLFGFYAANDPRIIENGLPVEIFSFASPLVGDARFRRAFKSLESKGKIMHARICNSGDLGT